MALAGSAVAAVAACASDRGPYPDLPPLAVQAEFTSRNLCGLGVSPEVRLTGVPAGTASFRWRTTNVSVLSAPRWQAEVPAGGAIIAEGAVADFSAPCPGEKDTLVFRFEVMALAADGRPAAYGWNFIPARSMVRQRAFEQTRAAAGGAPAATPAASGSARRPAHFIY